MKNKEEMQKLLDLVWEVECYIREYKMAYINNYTWFTAINDEEIRTQTFKEVVGCFDNIKNIINEKIQYLRDNGIDINVDNIFIYPMFENSKNNRRIVSDIQGVNLEDFGYSKGIYKKKYFKICKEDYGENWKELFKCNWYGGLDEI